jgi:hypothetical protein
VARNSFSVSRQQFATYPSIFYTARGHGAWYRCCSYDWSCGGEDAAAAWFLRADVQQVR